MSSTFRSFGELTADIKARIIETRAKEKERQKKERRDAS